MYRSRSRQHEHEFLGEESEAEFDGRYVYVYEQCGHAPVIDSVTDHARDETYTEHGDRCDAQRTVNVAVSNPVHVESGEEVEYDGNTDLWQALMNGENAESIKAEAIGVFGRRSPDKISSVVVEHEGEEYEIELTRDSVEVSV